MDGKRGNEKEENLHRGHRQKVKERFSRDGFCFDSFQPHEVLEILLFYVIPQKNTNDIAHRLIDEFGSLENVFSASESQLRTVKGIKNESARYLKIFNALNRYRDLTKNVPDRLLSVKDMVDYIKPKFSGKTDEMSLIVCLDSKHCVKECRTVLEGQINYTSIDLRRVLDIALSSNATDIILAHNHPFGVPTPSVNDIETTKYLRKILMQVSIRMIDHIIISPQGEYSMVSDPKYRDIFINTK